MHSIKLDLSKFKHIKSNGHSTTLEHQKDGHTITLAHKALSPENQKHLAALSKIAQEDSMPGDKAEAKEDKAQQLADGGKVQKYAGGKTINPAVGYDQDDQSLSGLWNSITSGISGGQDKTKGANYKATDDATLKKKTLQNMQDTANEKADGGMIKKYAEGTPDEPVESQGSSDSDVKEVDSATSKPQAPVTINIGQPQTQQQQQPMAPQQQQAQIPQQAQPQADTPPLSKDEEANNPPLQDLSSSQDTAVDKEVTDAENGYGIPSSSTTPAATQTAMPVKDELDQESQAWMQDLMNGHVKPETYKSLYAKQDTLGKIGTIFGLLLGGASSGLTHQPNVALEMMNNEINRDLEAQKQSKTNAQNFLRINQQSGVNAATIAKMRQDGLLSETQAKNMLAETSIKNFTNTQNQLLQSSFHDLATNTDKMPEGPQKEFAKKQLGYIYSKIGDKINDNNTAAQGAAEYIKALGVGGTNTGADNSKDFQNKNRFLRLLGPEGEKIAMNNEATSLSGVPEIQGQIADRPIQQADRDQVAAMQVLGNKGKDLLQFAKSHEGTLSPSQRAVAAQKAEEMINYYNASTKGGVLTEGRLKWLDDQIKKNPTSVIAQELMGNNARLEEIINSNDTRKTTLLNTMGFHPKSATAPSNKPIEGATGMLGKRPVTYKNGKWVYN